ncbi:MAG: hypothetical protein QXL61_06020, partial [Archaeoglobaceae archaeon]
MPRNLILLVLVTLIAFSLLGCVSKPEVREIKNYWSNVSDKEMEMITELKLYNPNVFPIPIK